jgi:hypothetical protein
VTCIKGGFLSFESTTMSDSACDSAAANDPPVVPNELDELKAEAEEVKRGIDEMVAAYQRGDKRRVCYWIGSASRQMVALGQKCVGKSLTQPKKRAIIQP